MLEELAAHLRGLESSTRLAALAVLRDGRTAAEAAAELRLPESIVAARVVRVLRRVGRLGDGGPEDVAVGIALFAGRRSPRDTVQARAVGHFYDRLRQTSRRQWRRAGLGERHLPHDVSPSIAAPPSAPIPAVDPAPAMRVLETILP